MSEDRLGDNGAMLDLLNVSCSHIIEHNRGSPSIVLADNLGPVWLECEKTEMYLVFLKNYSV